MCLTWPMSSKHAFVEHIYCKISCNISLYYLYSNVNCEDCCAGTCRLPDVPFVILSPHWITIGDLFLNKVQVTHEIVRINKWRWIFINNCVGIYTSQCQPFLIFPLSLSLFFCYLALVALSSVGCWLVPHQIESCFSSLVSEENYCLAFSKCVDASCSNMSHYYSWNVDTMSVLILQYNISVTIIT